MIKLIPFVLTMLLGLCCSEAALTQTKQTKQAKKPIPNRLIDYKQFEKIVVQSGRLREQRRLTETEFLQRMTEKNVVVLDARTDKRYEMLHIRGAVNLPFTEFTAQSLAKIIPNKRTKVLIYCNNNFLGNRTAFAEKTFSASLNLSTFTSLMSYGYKNIYELGPLLDVRTTRLPFDGEHAGLQKLFAASADWQSTVENRDVRYKLVRTIDGPDSPLAVYQETTDEYKGKPLRNQVESRSFMGFVIEDPTTPGKYVLAVTSADLQKYLRLSKIVAE